MSWKESNTSSQVILKEMLSHSTINSSAFKCWGLVTGGVWAGVGMVVRVGLGAHTIFCPLPAIFSPREEVPKSVI